MAAPAESQVLLIIFESFNTLDMNAPYEVFRKSGLRTNLKITVASETQVTSSAEGVHVKRDVPLDDKLISSLDVYDTLVVPGGGLAPVDAQASKLDSPFMKLIAAFAQLPTATEQYPRILLSICTGAIFLGNSGVFNNRRLCTTHWAAYADLAKHNQAAASRAGGATEPGTVLQARFVDSGRNDAGIRVLSSGGISCGLDASLYIVKLRWGEQEAIDTAALLDYAWRKTEGVIKYEEEEGGKDKK